MSRPKIIADRIKRIRADLYFYRETEYGKKYHLPRDTEKKWVAELKALEQIL
tara:strand:- start:2150 stop:2305 length:156 start_codon:yes stop_codon:yes gene_type:complete